LRNAAEGRAPNPRRTRAHRYLLFYKPYGVLTQFTDEGTPRPTLKDYIAVPDVYAVGRLDRDSEGLLLLTSDGDLQHRLSDPRFAHPRTYWAQVEGIPDEAALERLRRGLVLNDGPTRPAQARLLEPQPVMPPRDPPVRYRKQIPDCWIELVLTEGRNRQVRRMTAAVGHPTLRLVRVAIGSLRLEGLDSGAWRDLTPGELESLRRFGR
jgi:23S rRNA pseudouridine2457 synthase